MIYIFNLCCTYYVTVYIDFSFVSVKKKSSNDIRLINVTLIPSYYHKAGVASLFSPVRKLEYFAYRLSKLRNSFCSRGCTACTSTFNSKSLLSYTKQIHAFKLLLFLQHSCCYIKPV